MDHGSCGLGGVKEQEKKMTSVGVDVESVLEKPTLKIRRGNCSRGSLEWLRCSSQQQDSKLSTRASAAYLIDKQR